MVVRDGVGGAIDHEETRAIPARGWGLCDEMRRQVVVEAVGRERHGNRRQENEACAYLLGEFLPLFLQRRCSSVVEQRFRKAWVVGSIPTIGSSRMRGETGVFFTA
jgi:hypothetical protein